MLLHIELLIDILDILLSIWLLIELYKVYNLVRQEKVIEREELHKNTAIPYLNQVILQAFAIAYTPSWELPWWKKNLKSLEKFFGEIFKPDIYRLPLSSIKAYALIKGIDEDQWNKTIIQGIKQKTDSYAKHKKGDIILEIENNEIVLKRLVCDDRPFFLMLSEYLDYKGASYYSYSNKTPVQKSIVKENDQEL